MGFGRSLSISSIKVDSIGSTVELGGWIEDIRKMAKVSFLTLRDRTGIIQIVVRGQVYPEEITKQSTVTVSGTVQETKARDYDFEILAEKITILAIASRKLPVDPLGRLESSMDNRLNARALDMRNQKTAAIFKIRHHMLHSIRNTMEREDFIEITTPKIIASASEGGANLFSLEYFGQTAYLAQSPQLYKEQMVLGLERVYEIANFYRAENSHTGRHLTEFSSVDIEAAFMDYTDVMDVLEKIISNVYSYVAENCNAEQKALGRQIEPPKIPFERVTYTQLLEELRKRVKSWSLEMICKMHIYAQLAKSTLGFIF
ncbi:MAG: aspartate--tRNA(Asn) ligase [Cenarchaeum symbiont of Oopsacas minuta]|nr:aspartate--tRNA(Asn) ligase [Cenarchaeum symbiont of Oopsacas minuta]